MLVTPPTYTTVTALTTERTIIVFLLLPYKVSLESLADLVKDIYASLPLQEHLPLSPST
jgi:hypothetical protein